MQLAIYLFECYKTRTARTAKHSTLPFLSLAALFYPTTEMLGLTLLTSLLAASATLAKPPVTFDALTSDLPEDVSHIGLDEVAREYVAYKRDGTLFGRFPVAPTEGALTKRASNFSQCGDLTVGDAEARELLPLLSCSMHELTIIRPSPRMGGAQPIRQRQLR